MELDKAFVVSAIINQKSELFDEEYVTLKELSYIIPLLEKRLKDIGYDVHFSPEIENDYIFEISSEIIKKNSRYHISFEYEIDDDELRSIIYDEEFINDCLYNMLLERLNIIDELRAKDSSN